MRKSKIYLGILAIIYLRVSQREQEDGYSIPAQLRYIMQYAMREGIVIVGEPIIEIASAKKTGRKKFDRMVAFLRKEARKTNNRGVTAILTEKTDRLVRNHPDKETLLHLGITLHLTKEHLVVNSKSPSCDQYMLDNYVALASKYSRNLGEEASKGMIEKAEEGWYPSRAPFGYINSIRNDEKKIIVPDPVYSKYAKSLFVLYATGNYSLKTLVYELNRQMKDDGLKKKLIKSSVAKILTNCMYIGKFFWNSKLYNGKHAPLVTQELYDQVQSRLHGQNKHVRHSRDKNKWLFQGLLFCGHCGCAVVAEIKKNRYVYYHCTGNKGSCAGKKVVNEDTLLADTIQVLEQLTQAEFPLEDIYKTVSESQAEARDKVEHLKAKIKLDLQKNDQRRDSLFIKELDGEIEPERFKQIDGQLLKNIEEDKKRLFNLESDNGAFITNRQQLAALLSKAVGLFKEPSRSVQERRQLIRTFLGPSTLKDCRLHPTLRKPFDQFVKLRSMH